MNYDDLLTDKAKALAAQKHQLNSGQNKLEEGNQCLDEISSSQNENTEILENMLKKVQNAPSDNGIVFVTEDEDDEFLIEASCSESLDSRVPMKEMSLIEGISFDPSMNWDEYSDRVQTYLTENNIQLGIDPFKNLMTTSQRIELEKRIKNDFTLKKARCDKYDYMIAGTCGFIGGIVDIFFVGAPGEGDLTHFTDKMTDKAVESFASFCGWNATKNNSTRSAIGSLEGKFKVNYDHRHGGDVGGRFKMSTKNHHIKNLAHSPDLIGLFFSILDQFTNSAHFADKGKLICIDTEHYELKGSGFIPQIVAGFVNWLGHLFSDVSGSSGSVNRGSGIPIPFYSLLQFINVGEFGQYKQSFAQIAVQVFEKGYDFRHGFALAIPVVITELLARITWSLKRHYYDRIEWKKCIPEANNPELRRVLLVAHGSLCLLDVTDAGLRSGGNIISFMLRSNIIAWVRFGLLALKEVKTYYLEDSLDHEEIDNYLESEYQRLLNVS